MRWKRKYIKSPRYILAEADFPTGRIRYMMEEAGVDFILTEKESADKLESFEIRLTDCEICGVETPASERLVLITVP